LRGRRSTAGAIVDDNIERQVSSSALTTKQDAVASERREGRNVLSSSA
jgi:hypothetical protein